MNIIKQSDEAFEHLVGKQTRDIKDAIFFITEDRRDYFSLHSIVSATGITQDKIHQILESDGGYGKSMLSNNERGIVFFIREKISPLGDFTNFLRDICAKI